MTGVALFLWQPSKEGRKECILKKLQEAFEMAGITTFSLDISAPDAFTKLGEIDNYFLSVPFDKKHLVFSLDGDGFGLTLTMDGLWVDNIQYNVFTYLTKHPKYFRQELEGINSWYIAILNSVQDGVEYIEEKYPHLDGMEYMVFPAFRGTCCDTEISERKRDILLIADYEPEREVLLEKFCQNKVFITVYGTGWDDAVIAQNEYVQMIPKEEQLFERKLELMGQSKVVLFMHLQEPDMADVDIISAMANGAVVFTERTKELVQLFEEKEEIMLYETEDRELLPNLVQQVLKTSTILEEMGDKGKTKARQIGDLSCFVKKILERCK